MSLLPASVVWKALLLIGSLVSTVTAQALELFPQAVKFVLIVRKFTLKVDVIVVMWIAKNH